MDLIIPILILTGLALIVVYSRSREKKPTIAKTPCDNCPYWSECQGKDKSDCLLYKTEEDVYG